MSTVGTRPKPFGFDDEGEQRAYPMNQPLISERQSAAALRPDLAPARMRMVELQLEGRGIADPRVLDAMRAVPRERFLPERLAEFAYDDRPLPIGENQTISQPYIVALMAEAAQLAPGDRALEIGTGLGYAAAVFSRIAREVFTVERRAALAEAARERLAELGFENVRVMHGDGTKGWPEFAPYDAIIVAASGPEIPRSLRDQLRIGGRLVIPVGDETQFQELKRITRTGPATFEETNLGPVAFVPLIGAEGWREPEARDVDGRRMARWPLRARTERERPAAALIERHAEPLPDLSDDAFGALFDRFGEARIVLLGEATHGTSEFYRARAEITRRLVERHGFTIVAVEADWPDAAQIDAYVRQRQAPDLGRPFTRFPTWMWRNAEMGDFVGWLQGHNSRLANRSAFVSFHGLDLYSLSTSAAAVIAYLDQTDPEAARVARERYGCLTPWQADPATYGRAALSAGYATCEKAVVKMLKELLGRQAAYMAQDREGFFDAAQNARLVANAEAYYRIMYYGSAESWNHRDRHMFETLQAIRAWRGKQAKAVVWAHNSHVGNAAATQMGSQGEINIGQLCREEFGAACVSIGFGTDRGTVAAASDWDGPMEIKTVQPSHAESYERLCADAKGNAFLIDLRPDGRRELLQELSQTRLERAIGVIYRPETERMSHYFDAVLPRQFDAWVWFRETRAVESLPVAPRPGEPETFPFAM
jgi:protein-L-isoaspartate(D-aspartate) O-methyltransferase